MKNHLDGKTLKIAEMVGKKSNYIIRLFETYGRNQVFHFQFGVLGKVGSFPTWDDTFLIFTAITCHQPEVFRINIF